MAFDPRAYLREVVNPLRDHVGDLPGDLARHYAVEPGMTGAEIADRLATVRSYWRRQQGGSGAAARVCARMITRDGLLIRQHGDAMNDPDWWASALVPDEPEPPVPWEPVPRVVAEPEPPVPGEPEPRVVAEPEPPVVADSEPARPEFVERLRVRLTPLDQDRATAQVTWPTPPAGKVSVRRSAVPPPWGPGATVGAAELQAFGEPLIGDRLFQGEQTSIVVIVPSGRQVYVPFTIGGDGSAVVGAPAAAGVAEPVQQLRARRTGDEVTVSWVWPSGVNLVEVTFTPEHGGARTRRMTRGQVAETGCRVPADSGAGRVTVRAVSRGPGGDLLSPPRSVTVDGVATTLTYHLPRVGGLFSQGRRLLRVTVDRVCEGVELHLVVASGAAMPTRPDGGETVRRFTGLKLEPGAGWEAPFTLPKLPRPYWLRCFVTHPRGIRVVDPIDEMKVS